MREPRPVRKLKGTAIKGKKTADQEKRALPPVPGGKALARLRFFEEQRGLRNKGEGNSEPADQVKRQEGAEN
jgi:hypothetical protein